MKARPRLLPIVIGAASGLLFLKVVGALSGGDVLSGATPAVAQEQASGAQAQQPAVDANPSKSGEAKDTKQVTYKQGNVASGDSRDTILERLGERREELDQLEAQILERENLLKAAEKRVEERIAELSKIEERINATVKARNDEEKARFEGLIKMYAAMKPKDAARIFDRLDLQILIEVAARMKPEQMGSIMSEMAPDAAEQLTVALVLDKNKDTKQDEGGPAELPKIIGKQPGA
ncbi:MAG: MotE family protein [Flavobacteriaceae bacterium]